MNIEHSILNGLERKSSIEGGGLHSDSGARRRVLALGASEIEYDQNSLWHQHLSRLKPYSPQGETLSLPNKAAQYLEIFKDPNKNLCG